MHKSQEVSSHAGVFENVIWKFGERISAQLVSIIVSIVLARILSPEDYGIISIVMIIITLCEAFVTNGLGNALIQKKNADKLDFNTIFWFGFFLSVVIYIALFFCAVPISCFYEENSLVWIIRVMGLRIALASLNSIQHAYLAKKMQFKKFFLVGLIGTVASGIIGIYMAYAGFKSWALVAQYMSASIISTILLFFIVDWHPAFCFSVARLKILLPFGLKMMGVSLLDAGFNEIRSIVISAKYSSVDLAMYENGRKYPNIIANNVNASLGSVMFPAMSNRQSDRTKIKALMKSSNTMSMFIIAPAMLGFMAVAERFVYVVLTSKWLECVPYIYCTCVMCLFYPIHTINIQALNAIGESGKTLILEIIKKTASIVILLVTMKYGVLWIALGAMIFSLITTLINGVYSKHYFDYSVFAQLKDVLSILVSSAIVFVTIRTLDSFLQLPGIISLFLDVLVGVIVYVCLSWVFKIDAFKVILLKVKKILNK